MTDNAFVHYREGKAIHHVDASACVYVCVRVQYARGLIICRWRGSPQGFSVVVEGDGGELEALRVDVMQAKHLETRTLTGVKRGWVVYLAGGRGNKWKHLIADEELILTDTSQCWQRRRQRLCVRGYLFQHQETWADWW